MKQITTKNPRYSFGSLLIALIVMFAVNPFIPDKKLAVFSFHLFFSIVILVTAYTLSSHRWTFYTGLILGTLSIYSVWHNALTTNNWLVICSHIVTTLFLIFAVIILGKQVLSEKIIDKELIFGAISLYLFVGLAWGMIYAFILDLNPESFEGVPLLSGSEHPAVKFSLRVETMVYYSFVTLTTLGYGDIVPISLAAKYYSILEAVSGQMYIATILARLIPLMRVK